MKCIRLFLFSALPTEVDSDMLTSTLVVVLNCYLYFI